jgi:hypothetical protein
MGIIYYPGIIIGSCIIPGCCIIIIPGCTIIPGYCIIIPGCCIIIPGYWATMGIPVMGSIIICYPVAGSNITCCYYIIGTGVIASSPRSVEAIIYF